MPEFAGMAPRECQEMFSLEGMAWTFGRYLRIVRMKFLGTYQVNTRSGAGAKEEDATLPAANKATNEWLLSQPPVSVRCSQSPLLSNDKNVSRKEMWNGRA